MSGVRVLAGTRKGAFVLISDAMRKQWQIAGPHFPGWEISPRKGAPADPERLYALQYSAFLGQLIQHSNDGGKTWARVGNKVQYQALSIEPANRMARVLMGKPGSKDFLARQCSKNGPLQDRAHIWAFFNRPDEACRVLLPFVNEGLELGQKALRTN
jgi:hypothetical protein